MNSYYTENELKSLGIAHYGKDVFISRNTRIYSPEEVTIGDNCRIDDYTILIGKIFIGSHVHIAAWNYLNGSCGEIIIGDFSTLSGKCSVYTTKEGVSTFFDDRKLDYADVNIGREVVFGMGSIILPGTLVKDGNSFGAMSVAFGFYEKWGINMNYGGNKIAIRVKERKRDLLLREKAFLDEYRKQ